MFGSTLSMWSKSELSCVVGALVWFLVRLLDVVRCNRSSCAHESLVSLHGFWLQWKRFKNQIPKIQSWDTIHPQTRVKRNYSASIELWETDVCFLHIQLIGTSVWLPKIHKIPPDVDFESSRSPAKSECWNNSNQHCCAVFPTRQIVFEFTCDEYKISNVLKVCRNCWEQRYSETCRES